jgi:PAS domain S-box-containing protein
VLHMKYVSPAAEELLRMPMERWIGDVDAWFEHMHPDDVERMTEIARSALETGGPWNHTFRMIRGDGRIVWLLDRGRAIERDQAGRPTLFQGIFLDVTEEEEARLALEARERRYRSIVESLPAVPWSEVVDPDSGKARYAFIGPQVEAMFGYTAAELLMEPDHFFRLVHPDDRERVMTIAERCDRTGEPWDELYRVLHRDGSIRWILSRADRTFEDGRSVWHGLAFDLTRHIEGGAFPPDVRAAVGSFGTVEANETGGG